jgi:CRP/FNR family cyclic AMP-dependent transcriptional regulator
MKRSAVDALSRMPDFRMLGGDAISKLAAVAKFATYLRGQIVFLQGEVGNSLFAIDSGYLKVSVLGSSGTLSTLGVMGPGEIFGEMSLLDGGPRSATVTALTRATLVTIDGRPFWDLIRATSPIGAAMFELLARRLRVLTERSDDLTILSVGGRLAKQTLLLARRHGIAVGPGRLRVGIKLSQQELGEMIGATRESVNKHLRIWEDENVLKKEGGYLVILNLPLLQSMAQH